MDFRSNNGSLHAERSEHADDLYGRVRFPHVVAAESPMPPIKRNTGQARCVPRDMPSVMAAVSRKVVAKTLDTSCGVGRGENGGDIEHCRHRCINVRVTPRALRRLLLLDVGFAESSSRRCPRPYA